MSAKRGRPGKGGPEDQAAARSTTIVTDKATAAAILVARLAQHGRDRFTPNHEPSFWLRARLADLHARRASGQAVRCGHLTGILRPFAVHAMWAPDQLVCGECAPTLRLTGDADSTCDRCGQVDLMHPEILVVPGEPVLVTLGLCPPCHQREGGR